MNSSLSTDERWKLALDHDDVEQSYEHFMEKARELRDVRLAQALSQKNAPHKILKAMAQDGCFHSQWISSVMDVGLHIDWGKALAWRRENSDPEQLEREEREALHGGLNQYVSLRNLGRGRLVLEEMLLGVLNDNPGMIKNIDRASTIHYSYLFELASRPNSKDWLARSGMDIGQVVDEGVRSNKHLDLLNPWEEQTYREIGWRLNAWRNQNPAYQQAWKRVTEGDVARLEQDRDWVARWIPTGVWEDSPLKQWCDQQILGHGGQTNASPLDHDALRPLEGEGRAQSAIDCARDYAQALGYASMDPMRDRVRRTNNLIRERSISQAGNLLLECPTDYLVTSLRHRHVWMEQIMGTEEGARHLQAAMTHDWRAAQAAIGWGAKTVAQWTMEQPLWQTWRDQDGNSLLSNTLIAMAARDKKKASSLTKSQLLKFAKNMPALLLDTNAQGQRILDLIEVPASTRSAVERVLLKYAIQVPSDKRQRAPGRSM